MHAVNSGARTTTASAVGAAWLADGGSELCRSCRKRRGRIVWGDSLSLTLGFAQKRCGVCVYRARLKHAFGRTQAIPALLGKLLWSIVRQH